MNSGEFQGSKQVPQFGRVPITSQVVRFAACRQVLTTAERLSAIDTGLFSVLMIPRLAPDRVSSRIWWVLHWICWRRAIVGASTASRLAIVERPAVTCAYDRSQAEQEQAEHQHAEHAALACLYSAAKCQTPAASICG